MNWGHFDQLYSELSSMPASWFNHATGYYRHPGCPCCIAGHVVRLQGTYDIGEPKTLVAFLEISDEEAQALYLPTAITDVSVHFPLGPDPIEYAHAATGEAGRQRALARLRRLAERYGRPSSAFVPDDARFLASVRALASESLVVVTD